MILNRPLTYINECRKIVAQITNFPITILPLPTADLKKALIDSITHTHTLKEHKKLMHYLHMCVMVTVLKPLWELGRA